MRWLAVVIVLAASTASASPRATDADSRARLDAALVEIRGHVHALRYGEARVAAEAALAIGGAGVGEVAELARTLGEVTAALGDDAAAERWFVEWLTVDPRAELPPGTSPKLTDRLAAARAHAAGLELARPAMIAARDGRRVLELELVGDPGGLVAAISVIVIAGGPAGPLVKAPSRAADAPGRATLELGLPAGAELVEVSLRDAAGNELHTPVRATVVVVARPPTRRPPLLHRPWPYVAAGAVTAGLGGVFLWRRGVARDDLDAILNDSGNHTFAEAEDARARAERHGWLSLASFAVAGACAITAVILATHDHEVVVAPTAGGATVTARLTF